MTFIRRCLSSALLMLSAYSQAEVLGQVRTPLSVLGVNDKLVVEVFDDPGINGVSCYLSRAVSGGISGSTGLAVDSSMIAISCQQQGAITVPAAVANQQRQGEQVFSVELSPLFKQVRVQRFYDATRHTLVYLAFGEELESRAPFNRISAVPIRAWPDQTNASY